MLYTVYCFSSLQRCKWFSSTWTIFSCIWLYESWQILEQIFDKFKNLYPDIITTKKYLRSDGAGQYLNKSTQSVQWLWWKKKLSGILVPHHMEKVTVMDLGGTWKLYIREKTRARVIDLQTCLELCLRNLSQYQYYPLPNWKYWKCKALSW